METDSHSEKTLSAEILEIFQEVLRVSDLKADSHFFHEGGHSLLAIRVVSRIHRILEVKLSVRALFDHPTAEQLAAYITDIESGSV